MAKIKQAPLGMVSGKLGDVVFRIMNGQRFVSMAPKKYNISQSNKAKKGRANFAAVVKFAVTVNSIPHLKEVWSSVKAEGSNSYHRIIRYNGKKVNEGKLTSLNRITPEGLPLVVSSLTVQGDKLELIISFSSEEIILPALLSIVFVFSSDKILKQVYKIETPEPDNIYNLSIPLDYYVKKAFEEFPQPLIYSAVTGLKESNKKMYWTETAVKEI